MALIDVITGRRNHTQTHPSPAASAPRPSATPAPRHAAVNHAAPDGRDGGKGDWFGGGAVARKDEDEPMTTEDLERKYPELVEQIREDERAAQQDDGQSPDDPDAQQDTPEDEPEDEPAARQTPPQEEDDKMNNRTPATFEQLNAAFEGENDFIVQCMGRKATMASAQTDYIALLKQRVAQNQNPAANTPPARTTPPPDVTAAARIDPGTPVNTSDDDQTGTPFLRAAKQMARAQRITVRQAIVKLRRTDPEAASEHDRLVATAISRSGKHARNHLAPPGTPGPIG